MKYRIPFILGIAVLLALSVIVSSFAQEQPAEPEAQWLWGEVVSIDNQNNELLVRYFDYDAEQEKETNIAADDKTTYENVVALIDIKPSDGVSIDYLVFPDGKNLAKNISVEKLEIEKAPQQ